MLMPVFEYSNENLRVSPQCQLPQRNKALFWSYEPLEEDPKPNPFHFGGEFAKLPKNH